MRVERKEWIVCDFPVVAVRIREVSAIAAPEDLLRGLEQARAGEDRPVDRLVDVRFACTIPGDGRAAKHTGPGCSRKLRIVRQHAPGKQRKHHAARVEKGDPLPARPRFADKSELLVETDAAPEVIDPERQQGDTRSVGRHDTIPTSSALRTDSAAPPQEMAA